MNKWLEGYLWNYVGEQQKAWTKWLHFGEKGQEAEAHQENILNLPYLDSKEEKEEDAALALQIVPVSEALPSPTPTGTSLSEPLT